MTLSDSELRAMRRILAGYSLPQLEAVLSAKQQVMRERLDVIDDMMNDDEPNVIAYERALTAFNTAMDELERRRAGRSIESLPGMDRMSTHTHTMNGR
jgi:hypothetical protein